MSDLNISIGVDKEGVSKGIKEVTEEIGGSFQRLTGIFDPAAQKMYDAVKGIGDASKVTKADYDAFSVALAKGGSQLGGHAQKMRLQAQAILEQNKRIAEGRDVTQEETEAVEENTSAQNRNQKGRSGNVTSITRQVAAQRAALSTANNLTRSVTQLGTGTGNWAMSAGIAARQMALLSTSAASTGIGLKSLLSVFSGPAGIAIGLSVATTAVTMLISTFKSGKKEVEDFEGVLNKYIGTLDAMSQVSANAASSYGQEIVVLNTLRRGIQDVTYTREQHIDNLNQLRGLYPEHLQNFSDEAVLAGRAGDALDALAVKIKAVGTAMIAQRLAVDAQEKQMRATVALTQAEQAYNLAKGASARADAEFASKSNVEQQMKGQIALSVGIADALAKTEKAAKKNFDTMTAGLKEADKELKDFEKALDSARTNVPKETGMLPLLRAEKKELDKLFQSQETEEGLARVASELKIVNTEIERLESLGKKDKVVRVRTQVDKIAPLLQKSGDMAGVSGFDGVEKKLKEVQQWYEKAYKAIDDELKKSNSNRANLLQARFQLEQDQLIVISNIEVKERERVAENIARIQADSGIRAANGRAKQLAEIEAWSRREVELARGNSDIIVAIEEGRAARIKAVNARIADQEEDLWNKINQFRDYSRFKSDEIDYSDTLAKEYKKKLDTIRKAFREARKIAEGNPQEMAMLGLKQGSVEYDLKIQQGKERIQAELKQSVKGGDIIGRGVSRGLQKAAREFYGTLSGLGDKTREIYRSYEGEIEKATGANKAFLISIRNQEVALQSSIQNVFAEIVTSLTDSMNEVFLGVFVDQIKAAAKEGGEAISNELKIAAGVGLAGSLISSNTKKTSSLGQGAGGALSGGAAGFMVGGAPGAVVGAIVGGISGLFSASKARKEEKLQEQLLEEQKKQTKLLERQNALAYAASIIGQMTKYGIVTNVSRDAYGEIVLRADGRDLTAILRRADKDRDRGF